MTEEITTEAKLPTLPSLASASNGAGNAEKLVPTFRVEQEAARARDALSTRDAAVKELEATRAELEQLQQQYTTHRENHTADLFLLEAGFKHESVRRFFRKEYRESVADTPKDKRPEFQQWLEDNREDPLYLVHFNSLKPKAVAEDTREPEVAPADHGDDQLAKALRAVLAGNPERYAGQPAVGNETEWTVENIRKQRAKNGGTLGAAKEQILAQWRAKGVIK